MTYSVNFVTHLGDVVPIRLESKQIEVYVGDELTTSLCLNMKLNDDDVTEAVLLLEALKFRTDV